MKEATKNEDLYNAIFKSGKSEDYKRMYYFLFQRVLKALEVLNEKDLHSIECAIELLENAQCKTEEIFISKKQEKQENKIYSDMLERLNLQSIGCYIKDGSDLLKTEKSAIDKLKMELHGYLDEKTIDRLLPIIWEYTDKQKEIQFSVGMKAGARLELLLINDFERNLQTYCV